MEELQGEGSPQEQDDDVGGLSQALAEILASLQSTFAGTPLDVEISYEEDDTVSAPSCTLCACVVFCHLFLYSIHWADRCCSVLASHGSRGSESPQQHAGCCPKTGHALIQLPFSRGPLQALSDFPDCCP